MGVDIDTTKLTKVCPGIWQKNEKTFYIECSVLGTFHYCIKDRLDKLIQKHGSIEAVGAQYVSREGKRDLKGGSSDEPTTASAINISANEAPKVRLDRPGKQFHSSGDARVGAIFSAEWTRCIRPTLFKKNQQFCNGCRWYDLCKVPFKSWAKWEGDIREVQAEFYVADVFTESESLANMTK